MVFHLPRMILGAAFAADEPENLFAMMGPRSLLRFLDIFVAAQEYQSVMPQGYDVETQRTLAS